MQTDAGPSLAPGEQTHIEGWCHEVRRLEPRRIDHLRIRALAEPLTDG